MTKSEFDKLWNTVIVPEAANICSDYSDLLFAEFLKEKIYSETKRMIQHCKNYYMIKPEGYVDRHKVSASVMIAILKCTPIKIVGSEYYSENTDKWVFNEQLAITVGLSVLLAFAKQNFKKIAEHDETASEILKKFQKGIKLPKAKHGDYRSNWATELYHMRKEGNYNILALAHEMFFLEYITMHL